MAPRKRMHFLSLTALTMSSLIATAGSANGECDRPLVFSVTVMCPPRPRCADRLKSAQYCDLHVRAQAPPPNRGVGVLASRDLCEQLLEGRLLRSRERTELCRFVRARFRDQRFDQPPSGG